MPYFQPYNCILVFTIFSFTKLPYSTMLARWKVSRCSLSNVHSNVTGIRHAFVLIVVAYLQNDQVSRPISFL